MQAAEKEVRLASAVHKKTRQMNEWGGGARVVAERAAQEGRDSFSNADDGADESSIEADGAWSDAREEKSRKQPRGVHDI